MSSSYLESSTTVAVEIGNVFIIILSASLSQVRPLEQVY